MNEKDYLDFRDSIRNMFFEDVMKQKSFTLRQLEEVILEAEIYKNTRWEVSGIRQGPILKVLYGLREKILKERGLKNE